MMARLDIVHVAEGRYPHKIFYNVDAAVGKGCPNQRTDVLLVQYLLREGCKAPHIAQIQEGAGFKPSEIAISGIWSETWSTYLGNYLTDMKLRGKLVFNDQRVDPVVGGATRGALHHMQYTILYLNIGYGVLRPNDLPRLAEVVDCPNELREPLSLKFVGL